MYLRNTLILLAALGIVFCVLLITKIAVVNKAPPPPENPAIKPYIKAIAASGLVEALEENISIGVPIAALVSEVYVKVGDFVEKDDPLFKLDSRDLDADFEVQKSSVEVQKATLDRLKDQLQRLQSIQDPRAVSIDEVKTRLNDVKIAEAQLLKSQSELERTQTLIDRLTVRAPKKGRILQNNLRVGQYVSPTASQSFMILGNLDKLQVRIDIDEQNASRFDPSKPAFAYPKNNTDLKIPLKFERIEPYVIPKKSLTGATDERVDTRVLQVIYTFDQPKDFNLYVGQQVDAFIEAP